MTDAELIRAAIQKSGLSARKFATVAMGRDERTIRRWLAGHTMPAAARAWLARYLDTPKAESG